MSEQFNGKSADEGVQILAADMLRISLSPLMQLTSYLIELPQINGSAEVEENYNTQEEQTRKEQHYLLMQLSNWLFYKQNVKQE